MKTDFGEPDGLFGINCGHVQYPFAAGCSFQRYFPYPEEENSKRYRQFQQQRYMERQIRASKRECMMLDEMGDKEGFAKASAKLKSRKKQCADYCRETGLGQHNDRTQVLGFDRSVSAKATASYKNLLTNSVGKPIIKTSKTSLTGAPNSITQRENSKGGIERNYYDEYGKQKKQVASQDHRFKRWFEISPIRAEYKHALKADIASQILATSKRG